MTSDLYIKSEKEQQIHAQMLANCYEIMKKYKCNPFLSGGVLLGIYRKGDNWPWNLGAVINVISGQAIRKQLYIVDALKKKGFRIKRFFRKKSNWKIRADKGKFNIEIVGYHRSGDNYVRKTRSRIKIIPAHFFDVKNFKKIKFRKKYYNCPGEIKEYLSHLYENWRVTIKSRNARDFQRGVNFCKKVK